MPWLFAGITEFQALEMDDSESLDKQFSRLKYNLSRLLIRSKLTISQTQSLKIDSELPQDEVYRNLIGWLCCEETVKLSDEQLRNDLLQQFNADFQKEHLVNMDGWWVAKTEYLVSSLIARVL